MDKSLIMALALCRWIVEHHNLFISGSTGVGKSFLACVLGHKAGLEGYSVYYERVPALMRKMIVTRGGGSYQKMIVASSKTKLLILGDWRLEKLPREQSLELLEVLEDRVTTEAPPSSPPKCPCTSGTKPSAIPLWPIRRRVPGTRPTSPD
ncbi:hypothetical protein DFAR_3180027 [Desulfarculales bacterium]